MPFILSDGDIRKYGEQLTSILQTAASDAKFSGLKTNEEKFQYFVDLENKRSRVDQNINYGEIKGILHDLEVIKKAVAETAARKAETQVAPTATYGDYLQYFSTGERDFITYAMSDLNTASDAESFNTKLLL
jgi:hypothetical protein